MAIVMLLGMFPQSNYQEIRNNSKGMMQYAADALQKSLVEGIGSQESDVEILNLPFLGSYPRRCRKLYTSNGEFIVTTKTGKKVKGQNVRYCNLTYYKMWSRYAMAKRALMDWCKRHKSEEKIVLSYSIHTPYLKACVDTKRKYKDLKIVQIVPDLPEFMSDSKQSAIRGFLDKVNKCLLNSLYKEVDAYVLLSNYMTDRLPVGEKPWCVVEGIYDNNTIIEDINVESLPKRYIMYSGTLARRYGIMNLVEAFDLISTPDYGLVICGSGDTVNDIKEYAKKNKNIIYYGVCPREEVLSLQHKASLLVNPRTPEGEFTKYSFPSKTMEYLASGVPCLIYRLPGIPEEYYEHCFCIEKLGVEALRHKLEGIMGMDACELKDFGKKAQQFVFSEKNPIAQTKKILNMIKLMGD